MKITHSSSFIFRKLYADQSFGGSEAYILERNALWMTCQSISANHLQIFPHSFTLRGNLESPQSVDLVFPYQSFRGALKEPRASRQPCCVCYRYKLLFIKHNIPLFLYSHMHRQLWFYALLANR